jgi:hypothetical protein
MYRSNYDKESKIFRKNKKKEEKDKSNHEFNPLDDIIADMFANDDGDKRIDHFYGLHNSEIENTLKKYNYDYNRLLKRLTCKFDNDKLSKILRDCLISVEDYYNPTAKTFEILRNYIIYGIKPKIEDVIKVDENYKDRDPSDDLISDMFYFGDDSLTIDEYYGMREKDIKRTLLRYNNDYQRLIKRLTCRLSEEDLEERLKECGITMEEYNNPDAEIFNNLRSSLINGYNRKK